MSRKSLKKRAGLFGLNDRSNKDFTNADSWGKNQFNNSFPAALACYMYAKGLNPVYLVLNSKLKVVHKKISATSLFGLSSSSKSLFFNFEYTFTPNRNLVKGGPPNIDLVTTDISKSSQRDLRGLEIKLTALPDHTTAKKSEDKYGSEIVFRPNTIVHLALSIASDYKSNRKLLLNILEPLCKELGENDWKNMGSLLPLFPKFLDTLKTLLSKGFNKQSPLVMQPIWKTMGKKAKLHDQCLDIFVWSNFAFSILLIDAAQTLRKNVERPKRSVIWLIKMLYDFAVDGSIEYRSILAGLPSIKQTGKAFAVQGGKTNQHMACPELLSPRINKMEIRNIILGNGQELLSPERRFDAVLVNSPEIFR